MRSCVHSSLGYVHWRRHMHTKTILSANVMGMSVCLLSHTCMYERVFIAHVYAHVSMCMCRYLRVCVCAWVSVYICTRARCVCTRQCVSACIQITHTSFFAASFFRYRFSTALWMSRLLKFSKPPAENNMSSSTSTIGSHSLGWMFYRSNK